MISKQLIAVVVIILSTLSLLCICIPLGSKADCGDNKQLAQIPKVNETKDNLTEFVKTENEQIQQKIEKVKEFIEIINNTLTSNTTYKKPQLGEGDLVKELNNTLQSYYKPIVWFIFPLAPKEGSSNKTNLFVLTSAKKKEIYEAVGQQTIEEDEKLFEQWTMSFNETDFFDKIGDGALGSLVGWG